MTHTEIAELMNSGSFYEVAEKVAYNRNLDSQETDIAEMTDAWAKEVGNTGKDPDCLIAGLVARTINEELYNAPDELLDQIFNRGSIGEFDEPVGYTTPKNTLVAHEAAKGGTVDRSWIDVKRVAPVMKNRQVETDLSYVDLRRNGFKEISTLVTYMKEACQNALFYDVLATADAAVVGGDALIAVSGAVPTVEAMDKMSLYLADRGSDNVMITLNKYAQKIKRMEGYEKYMSDNMKDRFSRYGIPADYDGIKIAAISGQHRTGTGSLLIPDKRIYGVAGKIGTLDMKGEVHVYEDRNNQSEVIHLSLKDFTYSFMLTNIENFAKMTFSA